MQVSRLFGIDFYRTHTFPIEFLKTRRSRRKLSRRGLIRLFQLAAVVTAFLATSWAESAKRPLPQTGNSGGGQQTARDGQHDFDFNIGSWHTHIKRILKPFSDSTESYEMDGTVIVRKVWDGRAQIEEIEADGPKGHWEGLTLFLYNPDSHQWSQLFANSKQGVLTTPLIGSFSNGRGELYSQDTMDEKSILVRGVWSDISPDAHHYEESYSDDGGKTWKAAFIGSLTRDSKSATTETSHLERSSNGDSKQHDFDWDLGTWKMHISRLSHPLTGSKVWSEMDGVTVNSKVWNGRANLAEVEADGAGGHLELLALRLYNPASQQWSINFATSRVGVVSVPCIGEFKDGRGEFYDHEDFSGRAILVRFRIWPMSNDTAQSEQAFSDDGGKTWETNWINKYTRVNDHAVDSN